MTDAPEHEEMEEINLFDFLEIVGAVSDGIQTTDGLPEHFYKLGFYLQDAIIEFQEAMSKEENENEQQQE